MTTTGKTIDIYVTLDVMTGHTITTITQSQGFEHYNKIPLAFNILRRQHYFPNIPCPELSLDLFLFNIFSFHKHASSENASGKQIKENKTL